MLRLNRLNQSTARTTSNPQEAKAKLHLHFVNNRVYLYNILFIVNIL
jgi:hypothetical protein